MGKNKKRGANKNPNVKSPVKPEDIQNKPDQSEAKKSISENSKLEAAVSEMKIESSSSNYVEMNAEENKNITKIKSEKTMMISNKTNFSKTVSFTNGEMITENISSLDGVDLKMGSMLSEGDLLKMMNSKKFSDNNSMIQISKNSSRNVRITKSSTKFCSKVGPSPSVYFKWNSNTVENKCVSFYNEMRVTETAQWTHFCPIGWNEGYMGLLDGHSKRIIMCLWNQISDDDVEVVSTGDGVHISKFEHEGSGLCASFDFEWELNRNYSFLLNCNRDGPKSTYSGFVYHADMNKWINIATFKVTPKRNGYISGMYSYIEDYMCSGAPRAGYLGAAWFKSEEGSWTMGNEVKINNTFTSNIPMSKAFTDEHQIRFSVGLGMVEHMKESVLRPSPTEQPQLLVSVPPAL